jgi:predicted RNA-binding protein with PIN domain
MRWIVNGNNVFGSRPDGWWNDRRGAQTRFAQHVAEWCRTHDDPVTIVFDSPLDDATARVAGGNLTIVEARRRGRDAADHEIVGLVDALDETEPVTVVTSDRGLRARLPAQVTVWGAGRFLRTV